MYILYLILILKISSYNMQDFIRGDHALYDSLSVDALTRMIDTTTSTTSIVNQMHPQVHTPIQIQRFNLMHEQVKRANTATTNTRTSVVGNGGDGVNNDNNTDSANNVNSTNDSNNANNANDDNDDEIKHNVVTKEDDDDEFDDDFLTYSAVYGHHDDTLHSVHLPIVSIELASMKVHL